MGLRRAAKVSGKHRPAAKKGGTALFSARVTAQIMEYVKGSYAALHQAMAAINDGNTLEPLVVLPSARQKTPLQPAVDAVAHSNHHYRQMVECWVANSGQRIRISECS